MGNYQVTVIDCIIRKVIKKYTLYNVTEEQASESLQIAREHYTWKTGHYCDGNVKELTNK